MLNRRVLEETGGLAFAEPSNYQNGNSLEYIINALDWSIDGQEMFPGIPEKGAALGWTIIARHVFNDGNKRTGMLVCSSYMKANGYILLSGYGDCGAEEMALRVACSECSREEFIDWVIARASGVLCP